ncbi:uncharacterized protein [Narcine bancroftii]|uniref:uncharacterized protein isoform X12 n=1 Tax=Narcine bancroftii TaxID=1343680 RepID=UPI003830FD1E
MLVTGECQLLKISRRINSLRMMMSHVLQVKVQIYCHMFQEHWKDVEALRNSLHRRLSHYKAQPHHCRGCSRNSAMYDCNKYHKTQQISRAVKFREAIFWTCIRCYKKVWINRTGRNLEINGHTVIIHQLTLKRKRLWKREKLYPHSFNEKDGKSSALELRVWKRSGG